MEQDFERQRKEAEERVREMNRNYRKKAGINQPAFENKKKENPDLSLKGNSQNPFLRRPSEILKMLRLDGLKGDPDRLLLLGIFLLLSSDEADELLLYALLYIML